jgi:hypothetical protein
VPGVPVSDGAAGLRSASARLRGAGLGRVGRQSQRQARGRTSLDQDIVDDLRERYDKAVAQGITHDRLRDWAGGSQPGYALGCWLRDDKD